MRKIKWTLILLAALLLAGCRGQTTLGQLTDSRESIPFDQIARNGEFLATEFAAYYIQQGSGGARLIHVCPTGTESFVALCGKPNCAHNDENCNAAVSGGLGFYKNRIFSTAASTEQNYVMDVVSMLPDGSDRRTEARIPWIWSENGGRGPHGLVFHEKKLLLYYDRDQSLPIEEQRERLQVVDLESGEITEPFEAGLTPEAELDMILCPVEHYVFTNITYRAKDGSSERWRVRMDLDTGSIEKLFQTDPGDWGVDESYVDGNQVCWLKPEDGFWEYDMTTGPLVNKGLPAADLSYARWDGDYIYAMAFSGQKQEKSTLYILDHNYETVDVLALPDHMQLKYADADRLYFSVRNSGSPISAVADRAAIGTGKLAVTVWQEVEYVDPATDPDEDETPQSYEADPTFYEECTDVTADHAAKLREVGAFFMVESEEPEADGKTYIITLYCVPKGEEIPVPVCKKPGCDHTGADCDARFCQRYRDQETGRSVGVSGEHNYYCYQGRIYLFSAREDYTIDHYSVDPVTWERRLERNIPIPESQYDDPGHYISGVMLGDRLLLRHGTTHTLEFFEEETILADPATLETICDFAPRFEPEEDADLAYENHLYDHSAVAVGNVAIVRGDRRIILKKNQHTLAVQDWLEEIRLDTMEVRRIRETSAKKGTFVPHIEGMTATRDTICYYFQSEGFHEFDRKTGEDTLFPCAREDGLAADYMEDLIVLICDPTLLADFEMDPETEVFDEELDQQPYVLQFYTRDYRLLGTVEVPEDVLNIPLAVTDQNVYFQSRDGRILAVNRAQLEAGTPEWREVG